MINILFVCTANICRSPTAAGFMRAHISARDADGRVGSAGLLEGGNRSPVPLIDTMLRYGIDLSEHRSRTVTPGVVQASDVILTMELRQLREVAVLVTGSFAKTFTLKEFVRRARVAGSRPPGQPMGEWLEFVSGDRKPSDLLRPSVADEVADPYMQSLAAYETMCAEVDNLTQSVVELIWPMVETTS